MRPIVLVAAVLASLCATAYSYAFEADFKTTSSFAEWSDEISIAHVVQNFRTVTILYRGRPDGSSANSFIGRAGVNPGTTLFKGVRRGPFVNGIAYFFRSGCPPVPYLMQGKFEGSYKLSLSGRAPLIRDRVSCAVWYYTSKLRNANLTFTRQ